MHTKERMGDNEAPLIGRCLHMCPEMEKLRRCKEKQIHILEIDSSDQVIAVKEFIRAGAGHAVPHPDDLRPSKILEETVYHLIRNIAERKDHPWHLIYDFVHNRLQSIRQDITYQQLDDLRVQHIFQMATRLYLYSQYRLWTHPMDKFDAKLNRDHLQQCLTKLLRNENVDAEFVAYYLLANLGNSEAITHTLQLDTHLRHKPRVQLSLAISICYLNNDYVRLFRLTGKLFPLEICALLPHISNVRRQALQTICCAYSSRNAKLPLHVLCRWLKFEDTKATENYCQEHGLEVSGENVLIRKGAPCVLSKMQILPISVAHIEQCGPSHFIL